MTPRIVANRRQFLSLSAAVAGTAVFTTACGRTQASVGGLSDPFVWSTYGTGTSTYNDLAAVSDAVASDTGARVRIITSDTPVGRLAAMRADIAQAGRLGDEYFFGYHGVNEFANEDWGPQDLRMVWAPLSPHSLMVKGGSGIETYADLAGKRIPRIAANPSVNMKIEGLLAYGGLAPEDVTWVDIGYGDQPEALKTGKIDTLYQQVYGSPLFELESQMEVAWLPLDPEDTEAVKRLIDLVPTVNVLPFSGAPGQAEGEETHGLVYTLPISVYAHKSADEVYALVSSMARTFPKYEDTTLNTPRWNPEDVEVMPKLTPFHDGTVRWLTENGMWTPEAEAKNQELIAAGATYREEWAKYLATEPKSEEIAEGWPAWIAEKITG
ncbi:TAXI family TRAP transporter solute-binding subunit [Brevibacterium samyangense]|uniref:TRAP transporter solute receptor, TAXI family n=1 Tax=Brevibacterium samyangense TaxID=366888 RepID=A0ABN2TF35_9MICO